MWCLLTEENRHLLSTAPCWLPSNLSPINPLVSLLSVTLPFQEEEAFFTELPRLFKQEHQSFRCHDRDTHWPFVKTNSFFSLSSLLFLRGSRNVTSVFWCCDVHKFKRFETQENTPRILGFRSQLGPEEGDSKGDYDSCLGTVIELRTYQNRNVPTSMFNYSNS